LGVTPAASRQVTHAGPAPAGHAGTEVRAEAHAR